MGAVRLVKLLYLLEVEFYKIYGRRLTSATWRYYLYGPYPDEFREVEANLVVEDVPLAGDRVLRRFSTDEDARDVSSALPWEETRLIPILVKEWGDASLNSLLNYVYFYTAPMKAAKRREEVLDFSTLNPEVKARMPRGVSFQLPSASIALPELGRVDISKVQGLLREFVERELSKCKPTAISPRKDSTYFAALEAINSSEKTLPRGDLEVTEEDFPFLSDQK
jgi:hypothetical protein